MVETALVTGASGFLGGHVVRDLLGHGYRVIAAGRNATALPPEANGSDPRASALVGDLDALAEAETAADVIVHCAALSSPWGRWREFEHVNVTGTRRVLELARRIGARRMVHISSPGIYAAPRDRVGIREHEVDPRHPMNGYIRSKLAAEALLHAAARTSGGPEIVILRPRGIIGQGDPSLVPRMLRANERVGIPLMRGGAGLVDLTAVENVALAVRLALRAPGVHGEAFNVSNGDPRPFRALLEQLFDGLGLRPRWRPVPARAAYGIGAALEAVCSMLPGRPEPPFTRYTVTTIAHSQTLDITKAREQLGYEPTVSIDESLAGYAGAGTADAGRAGAGTADA